MFIWLKASVSLNLALKTVNLLSVIFHFVIISIIQGLIELSLGFKIAATLAQLVVSK